MGFSNSILTNELSATSIWKIVCNLNLDEGNVCDLDLDKGTVCDLDLDKGNQGLLILETELLPAKVKI